ncbi:MAG TPA: hypothetical protein VGY91_04600 [Chthoniobacterales bacterium]|jgi:3-hydroxyisobutyrate dehydrogenase-like beta-hydroxyacid dehydrogenase|nr:hypothetical protein [Chthoniobacterales bacterium]
MEIYLMANIGFIGERLLKRNFTPGFRIEQDLKDLSLALEGAKTPGVDNFPFMR